MRYHQAQLNQQLSVECFPKYCFIRFFLDTCTCETLQRLCMYSRWVKRMERIANASLASAQRAQSLRIDSRNPTRIWKERSQQIGADISG